MSRPPNPIDLGNMIGKSSGSYRIGIDQVQFASFLRDLADKVEAGEIECTRVQRYDEICSQNFGSFTMNAVFASKSLKAD